MKNLFFLISFYILCISAGAATEIENNQRFHSFRRYSDYHLSGERLKEHLKKYYGQNRIENRDPMQDQELLPKLINYAFSTGLFINELVQDSQVLGKNDEFRVYITRRMERERAEIWQELKDQELAAMEKYFMNAYDQIVKPEMQALVRRTNDIYHYVVTPSSFIVAFETYRFASNPMEFAFYATGVGIAMIYLWDRWALPDFLDKIDRNRLVDKVGFSFYSELRTMLLKCRYSLPKQ